MVVPDHVATILLVFAGVAWLLGLAAFGRISLGEQRRRAAAVAAAIGVAGATALFAAAGSTPPLRAASLVALLALGGAGLLVLILPIGTSHRGNGRPARRIDERDIMFARARLRPGSADYDTYYAMRPQHKENDDRTRALPGLLSGETPAAEPVAFASAKASFALTEFLRDEVDGRVATRRKATSPAESTATLERLARQLGACAAGVTELKPYHVYTHVGRGSGSWGDVIRLDHRWAVAFTVEMDYHAMRSAPAAPVVAESAHQYVESAKIGIQLAAVIRRMGYPARAHIDGNYRVIAPLVARDAGLGEIGRMGILMTPGLGPRVRLGVVTTDLPLVPDRPGDDVSVIDFCSICNKCARNCPSESIPFGERETIDGGRRWAIDADSCFRYWNAIGTDCGRCMTVCPYSHPDNAAHNLVRWTIRRSGAARRGALWLDDLFYGRRPRAARTTSTYR